MATIQPFKAIRPEKFLAPRVAALPYDVYSREEAATEASREPLSFLNIDRPETQFGPDQDMYAPEVYEKARELLERRRKEGVLIQDPESCFYLYELTMEGRTQTGLVACASIDDYIGNVIKKHENTRAEKEADRICHVDVCGTQTGPIFLAYRGNRRVREITARVKEREPIFDFVSGDGIGHRGWKIDDGETIRELREIFRGIDRIYIADGHHRAASAVRVGLRRRAAHPDYDGTEEFNYFLSILFPDDELLIMDYNRVARDLNGLTEEEFLKAAEKVFEIQEEPLPSSGGRDASGKTAGQDAEGRKKSEYPSKPRKKGELLLYLPGRWYRLTVRPEYRSDDPVAGLDVSILQRELLSPVLGIRNQKTDQRVDFIGGIRGLEELCRRVHTDCAAAFALHPTSIQELFAVADAGLLMPPKSTWFEPKLRSGLFLHEIER